MRECIVEKILLKNGFPRSEIFHSPIWIWWMFWIVIFSMGLSFWFALLRYFISLFSFETVIIYVIGYVVISYLIIKFLNRSFAITDGKILIVNSHPPFREFEYFNFNQIQKVKISSDWRLKILIIFGIFHTNYIQIETKFQKKRFYCLFLDVDCYDENFTEKTLDDLATSLKSKGVIVNLEI